MRAAVDVETIVVPSETHALVLEANLIKEYKPKYNILLRDDKSYPFIKVTLQDPFPRVFVTRRVLNDGARYFGPYNRCRSDAARAQSCETHFHGSLVPLQTCRSMRRSVRVSTTTSSGARLRALAGKPKLTTAQ